MARFEQKLIDLGVMDAEDIRQLRAEAKREADEAAEKATSEAMPTRDDVNRETYAPSSVYAVYPVDYTGLPGQAS